MSGGHLTKPVTDQSYSGMVYLMSSKVAILIDEINGHRTMVGNICNAYLETKTKEKVYFVSGTDFGCLKGHTMIIIKKLYGLRTSGTCWNERLSDNLMHMGFKSTMADTDLWYRDAVGCCEYVSVYVDDLCYMGANPD